MTDRNGNRIVTVPSPANEIIATAKGSMTYGEWCQREADRNNRASKSSRYHLLTMNDGKVCVVAR